MNEPIQCLFPALTTEEPCQQVQHRKQEVPFLVQDPISEPSRQWLDTGGDRCWYSIIHAAWAIVLRSYTACDHVRFGSMDFKKKEEKVATDDQGPEAALSQVESYDRYIDSSTLVQHLLQPSSSEVCASGHPADPETLGQRFNTCVCVANEEIQQEQAEYAVSSLKAFQVIILLHENDAGQLPSVWIHYTPQVLCDERATVLADTLAQAMKEVLVHTHKPVGALDICSNTDVDRLSRWNMDSGNPPQQGCVYETILQQCHQHPGAPAISAWDGGLTYGELHRLSSALASQLQKRGVGPENFVGLCFDKSKWALVAVLGVIKAGGAYAFLDATHPAQRNRRICQSMACRVVVCSPVYAYLAEDLAEQVISLGEDSTSILDFHSSSPGIASKQENFECTLENALYAIFTSGSTGEPKGVVTERAAFYSMAQANGQAMGLGPGARVLQFASYTFDVSNRDMLIPLMFGGCVCIPSNSDRINDLAGFITRHGVTHASMTPSVANVISPSSTPTLKMLVLGGEPMTATHITTWAANVRLMNAYGVSESTGIAALASDIQVGHSPMNIGQGCGSRLWVVSTDNPNRLAPIGAIGELVIQGPAIARHYLHDPKRTERQFPRRMGWQSRFSPEIAAGQRLYRTGDLVRYNLDRSIHYIGRRDTQVKINGQRLELGDTEQHIRKCPDLRSLPIRNVAVITADGGQSTAVRLIAILDLGPLEGKDGHQFSMAIAPDSGWDPLTAALRHYLSSSLPGYMIPAQVLFAHNVPLTTSGKTNRSELRKMVSELLSREDRARQIRSLNAMSHNVQEDDRKEGQDKLSLPLTAEEYVLQALWAEILGIGSPKKLQRHNNFFARGGDSIGAMKLVAGLRKKGFELSVADVFKYPTLSGMASIVRPLIPSCTPSQPSPLEPFSLITEDYPNLIDPIRQELRVDANEIEDIYPCTPMQEGLVALTTKYPGAYTARYRWYLPESLDLDRFRAAWEMVWTTNPILRTRVVQVPQGLFQAVVRTDMPWEVVTTDAQVPGKRISLDHGPLVQLTMCLNPEKSLVSRHSFILDLHHALFDDWSLHQTLEEVERAYHGEKLHARPFNTFVQYLFGQQSSALSDEFWQSECAGLEAADFPVSPQAATGSGQKAVVEQSVEINSSVSTDYTISSILRLAWAIVLWHRTGCKDVLFGTTLTGRNAAMEGIDQVSGPTLATVPVRIQLPVEKSVNDSLLQVQEQFVRIMGHEQTGLRRIRQAGPGPAAACGFQNLMLVQPRKQQLSQLRLFQEDGSSQDGYDNLLSFTTYPFMLVCTPGEKSIGLQASFDAACIPAHSARQILAQMAHVCRQLMAGIQVPVSDISLVTPDDVAQLRRWNTNVPVNVNACIHDLIQERCRSQPDAVAVCSMEIELTYGQLDQYSTRFADRLLQMGVQRGHFVPLLFEKSPWITVAMLGVLKAGAAFVPLESSYPFQRLKEICMEVGATLVVSSEACDATSRELHDRVMIISSQTAEQEMAKQRVVRSPLSLPVAPDDPAYVVFTSGSTGKAKGILIHHSAISSSSRHYCDIQQLTPQCRVFQYSSYAFDVSVGDNLSTLMSGACLCVPNDVDRKNNPTKAMADLRVTIAVLTPSVMDLVHPDSVPTLRTLLSIGEALTAETARRWIGKVWLVNLYGPAECSVQSSCQQAVSLDPDPGNIGRGIGAVCWVVDHNDHHRLIPVGAVGELVLEGPIVGSGYLNNPHKTAEVFIEAPQWLKDFRFPGYPTRLYKTGDLVSYAPDGSLDYHGRKDLQVKLNGQRLELGEVEHQTVAASRIVEAAVADVIQFEHAPNRPVLVSFVRAKDSAKWGHYTDCGGLTVIDNPEGQFYVDIDELMQHLREQLPSYMIPSVTIPLSAIPLTLSGKLDRRLLREQVAKWSLDRVQTYHTSFRSSAAIKPPVTEEETQIHQLMEQALGLEGVSFGMESNFFALGGDSVAAMRMAAMARDKGLQLTVAQIFRSLTLSDMAGCLSKTPESDVVSPTHGQAAIYQSHCKRLLQQLSMRKAKDIVEVLPTTEFQQGTLRRWHCRYLTIALPKTVDLGRLLTACQKLVQRHPILRTAFAFDDDGNNIIQIVMRELDVQFTRFDSAHDIARHCEDDSMAMQTPLDETPPFQVQLVTLENSSVYLALRMAHAQFDGLSIPVICEELSAVYNNKPLAPTASFLAHLQVSRLRRTEEAYQAWTRVLHGAQMTDLRCYRSQLGHAIEQQEKENYRASEPRLVTVVKKTALVSPPFRITVATLVKAAWAMTLMHFITSESKSDVVFGQVVHGRNLGILQEDRIVGPCLNIIPVRVDFTECTDSTAKMALLQRVQEQHLETMPFENLDFSDIARRCTPWAPGTAFGSFVRFQGFDVQPVCWLDDVPCGTSLESLPNPPSNTANVLVVPRGSDFVVTMTVSNQALDQMQADSLVNCFCDAIQHLGQI